VSSPHPSADVLSSPFRATSATEVDFAQASFSELRAAHQALQQAYATLQTEHKHTQDEHEETLGALREVRMQGTKSPTKNIDVRQELHLKAEIDRLRQDLYVTFGQAMIS
jgi:chromosome segregation ATPase